MPESSAFLYCPACDRPDALKVVWEHQGTRGCACTMCGAQVTIHIPSLSEKKRAKEIRQQAKRRR